MNLRALAVVLVLAMLALFAAMNWTAFTTPTALTLGVAAIQAPLGLIMLAATVAVSAVFLVYIVLQQAGVILEARRYAKELKTQRELADRAEASRFTELRTFLEGELRRIEGRGGASNPAAGGRIEQLEQGLNERLAESTRTLTAYLGEIEDKLDRVLQQRP